MKRTSTVIWHGTGKQGSGLITSQSKAIENANYAYATRYEDKKGTNPEELIAAAHAGCFTMKFSFMLEEAGFKSDTIETKCTVTLEDNNIIESHLAVNAKIPGIDEQKFYEIAEKSKNECPVSKALNTKITLETVLSNEKEYSPDESFII